MDTLPKISPAQGLLLRTAARRADGRVIPPGTMRGGARIAVLTALLQRGWIEPADGGHALTDAGYAAIGHNRYATTGGSSDRNIQPIFADFDFGGLALAHNGNLTNAYLLRRELVRMGCLFQSTTDTEVINHLIARSNYSTVVDRVIDALGKVKGAYSLLMLTNEALLGVRDPMGIRPLCIGRLEDAWIVTSESVALDILGARFVRDVEPGEIVIVNGSGLHSIKPFPRQTRRFCVFEHIYFARPDTRLYGQSVHHARVRQGELLAAQAPVEADMQQVDAVIRARLTSDVTLVSQVAEYIITSGGKRLRPALLLLSAFWTAARRVIVARLPGGWASRLPVIDRLL